MYKAVCFESLDNGKVRCNLCRHHCIIVEGSRGICKVRENRNGILYSLSSGILVAEHVDPVEKKPLYHVMPGTGAYSIASVGCNFHCLHCQNAQIAKYDDRNTGAMPGTQVSSREVVNRALDTKCSSIAYTYTEPTVWFEYCLETARISAEAGLFNIFITNGYITSEALSMISPVLHAANIDLKGFTEQFYNRVCGARLKGVLDGIREYKKRGIWIEITTLVIPGENDEPEQLQGIAKFISEELGAETPWHVSRFFPCHQMTNHPPTPLDSMEVALEAGDQFGLKYIYQGNISGGREHTICPSCGAFVIGRNGYRVTRINMKDGACGSCGKQIAGIWG